MELTVYEVDAALVSLKVVQPEKQVDFVVLEHSEWALDCLFAFFKNHISTMHAAQDTRRADTYSHACKSSVQLV